MPRVFRHLAWATGVACLLTSLAIIERAPMPSLDEVYLVSVANTIAQGVDRAPRLNPPPEWVADYEKLYGPVFFYTEAAFIRLFGLSLFTGRVAGWAGTVLLCATMAWLVRLAGGSAEFATVAFAVTALTPEVSVLARNGRMDSMAIFFELAGTASLLTAWRTPGRSVAWGLVAGLLWALAVLTTPRTLPLLAGLLVGAPLFLANRDLRGSVIRSLAGLYAVVLAAVSLWALHLGLTVYGWFWWLWDGVKDDVYNIVLPGHERFWGMGLTTAITPVILVLGTVGLAFITLKLRIWSWPAVRSATALPFWFLVAAMTFNVVFYLVVANYAFVVSEYFVLPVLAVLLMATAMAVRGDGRAYRPLLAFWIATALCFGGYRSAKYIEVWQTWELRDPSRILAFLERHVPRGSIVFADDQYYFYAVENAGAKYRTFYLENAGLDLLKIDRARRQTALMPAEPSFLLWPVADPNAPFPSWYQCAKPYAIATYETSSEAIGIERLAPLTFLPYLHGYPTTILYRVPADCPVHGP
jgi:4-amino-4-deoxy-L-arabinose transferase-like glycosyltransferase